LELRKLLHSKESWALPIIVLLNSGESARKADKAVSTIISQLTQGGFHIQVNVNLRQDLNPNDLRKEIIRALLAERILRNQKEITAKRSLLLPDWLYLGIMEALDYRQRARPSTLFAAIFKSGKIFGIEEIIEASASDIDDALSKSIYQTSCCALVLALLDQPDSGMRMEKFLNSLANDPRTERELLNQWFPNFASSEASLNKWWALQLATLASPSMAEPLSTQDTLTALEDAITFRYQAKPSEIPHSSRPIAAAAKPSPPKPRPAPVPEPEVKEAPPKETAEAPPAAVEPEKPGIMSRLNPFSKRTSSDDEIAAAIEEASRAESENAMPKEEGRASEASSPDSPPETSPAATAPNRQPLFNRWFGDEPKPKDAVPEEPKPQTEDKPTEKPTPRAPEPKEEKKPAPKAEEPAAKPAEEPEAEKKPSSLNPLKWFRSGKKDKEEKTPEEAPPAAPQDKKAALSPAPDSIAAQLMANRPIFAFVYQEIAVEEEPANTEKKRFFGIFGKKKIEEKPAEPEPKEKTEDTPKEDKKPTPKPKETVPAEEPKEEEPAPSETSKAKRQPLRLHLFGGNKSEDKNEEKAEMPAEEVPTPEPKPEPEVVSKPKPRPAPPKPQPPKNESLVAAAIPIEDYAAILNRKDLDQIMLRNVNALAALQNRGAVLFRPIVADYISAMEDILKGRTKGLDARLLSLRERTQTTVEKSNAIRDLLDVHEANRSPSMSGIFEDYLKLPETIQKELPERTDPISKYLDALDKEFSKK